MQKNSLLVLTAVVAFSGLFLACEKKAVVETDIQKGSYAIGQNIGNSVKSQPLTLDLPALIAGLTDAASGKPSKLKPEEIRDAMMKLQQSAMGKMNESGEKNKKEGEAYLEANKKKEGWKTTDSGLQYKPLKEGTGASPKDGDIVKVHYTGTFINGEKFDSSVDRGQPIEFPVNGVIRGWTEALKMMKPGAKYQLVIPSDLAYGPSGKDKIGPNTTLLFDVELFEVKPGGAAGGPPGAGGNPHDKLQGPAKAKKK